MSIPMQQPKTIADLTNKVALITGASSGLGAAMARHYIAAGAYVVNADISPNPPNASPDQPTIVDTLNEEFPVTSGPPRMLFVQTNVTDPSSVENAVNFTVASYGRLDIMVNNAGIGANTPTNTDGVSVEKYDHVMAVNIKGVWLGIKYGAAQLLKQEPHISGDRGWIINSASVASVIALPHAALYCLSKGAVLHLTKATAYEYAPDKIHVNCINPGFVDTPILEAKKASMGAEEYEQSMAKQHPWGRMANADDIAKTCVFMAGSGVSGTTGQPFIVDGGYTLP